MYLLKHYKLLPRTGLIFFLIFVGKRYISLNFSLVSYIFTLCHLSRFVKYNKLITLGNRTVAGLIVRLLDT